MLAIRKETDYAIRCVLYLSRNTGNVILVDEIAESMQIPKSFLVKILQKLSKAGIIRSRAGGGGGHTLAKSSNSISIYDVLVATEGPVAMNRCAVNKNKCSFTAKCIVHPVWITVKKDVERILQARTFDSFR